MSIDVEDFCGFSNPPVGVSNMEAAPAAVDTAFLVGEGKSHDLDIHDHHEDGSLKSLLAGGVGGTFEVLTDHPIDLVKVRMQTATTLTISGTSSVKPSKHFLPILSHVVRQEGFTGLFQGASVRVASHMPATAVSFCGYDWGKRLVRQIRPQDEEVPSKKSPLSIAELSIAGALSGIPVTLFETPLERIKCLLQVQAGSPIKMYNGPVDCGAQLIEQAGVSSLYRGTAITAARNIPGLAVWFGTYELLKREMNQSKLLGSTGSAEWMNIIVAGGFAGSASWSIMMPFDAIKSVVQTSPHKISAFEAFDHVTSKSKLALFRGIGPTVLIAFPANAMCFLGMEIAWKALSMFD